MTTTTKPIPLFGSQDAVASLDRLRELMPCHRCHYVPTCLLDTHPLILGEVQGRLESLECSPSRRIDPVLVGAVTALIVRRRAQADDEMSRPIDLLDLKAVALCHDVGLVSTPLTQPVVPMVITDNAEPLQEPEAAEQLLEFQWSKTRRKIRAAAKAYSEQTHADY